MAARARAFTDALRVLGAVAKGEPSTALILFMTYAFHAAPEKVTRWPAGALCASGAEAVAGAG
jgi:hypothetical protein